MTPEEQAEADRLTKEQEDADLNAASDEESQDESEETVEELRERLELEQQARAKAEEVAENQRIRAEKAERKGKEPTKEPKPAQKQSQDSELSTKDLYALTEAKVPLEDVDDVLDYAKFKGISVQEALKSSVVKTTLSEKAEQRKTAEATNTTGAKRVNVKDSDDTLLNKAEKGELPESEEDMIRLFKARKGIK